MFVLCSVTQLHRTLQPCGLQLARLLCPWDFPGKNAGGTIKDESPEMEERSEPLQSCAYTA